MRQRKKLLPTLSFSFLLLGVPQVHDQLLYQNRGDRYEGIKPRPVSGYDIELVSARVDYEDTARDPVGPLPDKLTVKFYLENPIDVFLTVREIDYRYYYWLDNVQPVRPWRSGFDNTFAWTTGEVLQHLDGLEVHDLGVVARLGKPDPSMIDSVAPAILFVSKAPQTIEGYAFTFRTSVDTRLLAMIYQEGIDEPVFEVALRHQEAGRPFTVRWPAGKAPAGPYRLVIRGFMLSTNEPISQTVRFYHQPDVSSR